MPALSVIVPVHNGQETIQRCLAAVMVSPECECIVVDDGSTDATFDLIDLFPVRKLKNDTATGPARARNIGASAARGDILVFIDADVEVQADTLTKILDIFARRPDLHALIGSYDDDPQDRSTVSLFKNLLHHYVHQNACEQAKTFWAGCGAVRRQTFLRLEGMDESFRRPSVEDIEFGYRLWRAGLPCEIHKEIQVKHLKRWTFTGLIKTDLISRAIPWTEVMWLTRNFPANLNFDYVQRISSLLVYAILGFLAFGLFQWPGCLIALLLILIFILLNQNLYRFLLRRGGVRFLLKSMLLHFLYSGYSALGFGIGTAKYLLKTVAGRQRRFHSCLQKRNSGV